MCNPPCQSSFTNGLGSESLTVLGFAKMSLIVVVAIAVACSLLLQKFINVPHHAQEPPLIPHSIPYVGHLLGILRDGTQYYSKIR